MKKINIKSLNSSYMIFGNKGNVWNDSCHAFKNGSNLCSTPALSTNHARLNNVQNVGCKDCLEILNKNEHYDDGFNEFMEKIDEIYGDN